MAVFVVNYAYDPRTSEQDEIRPQHRAFLRGLFDNGTLLASGPWTDSGAGAMLLLRAEDADAALAALDEDPFWREGFIASRTARGWNPVIGPWG